MTGIEVAVGIFVAGLFFSGPYAQGRRDKKDWKKQVAYRKQEQSAQNDYRGRQVWYSFYTKNRNRSHWVIAVGGKKYELRKDDNMEPYFNSRDFPELEGLKAELDKIAWGKKNFKAKFFPMMIGWTSLSDEQIEAVCQEVGRGWRYSLWKQNCHHFVKAVSDRIIFNQNRAADWAYFRTGTGFDYHIGYKRHPDWGVRYGPLPPNWDSVNPTPIRRRD